MEALQSCRAAKKHIEAHDHLEQQIAGLMSWMPKPRATTAEVPDLVIKAGTSMAAVKRALVAQALSHCRGNKSRAAAMLGISESTIYNLARRYGVSEGR